MFKNFPNLNLLFKFKIEILYNVTFSNKNDKLYILFTYAMTLQKFELCTYARDYLGKSCNCLYKQDSCHQTIARSNYSHLKHIT